MNRPLMIVAALGFALSLSAEPLLVSTSGTFAAGTTASTWSAAGDTWAFSFYVDSNPVVTSDTIGTDFDAPISGFVYTLNGSPVSVGPVDVEFFNISDFGLINVCFFGCVASGSVTNGFVIEGPQVYSGLESAPTILPGTYAETSNTAEVTSTATAQALGTVYISPEPSTWGLSAAGLLVLAANFLRKKSTAATGSSLR